MKTKRTLLVILAVTLAAILIFGGILFALSAARRSRAVASYKTIYIERGAYSYFASYYKGLYLTSLRTAGISASDTPAFWNLTDAEGVSYGTRLSEGFTDYMRRTLVAAALFDSAGTLTDTEKKRLTAAAEEMLDYRANGDKKVFNEMTEKYGFTYDDYVDSITILYKAGNAMRAIYGENGEALKNTADAKLYLETEYRHVFLLALRTEDKFLLDDSGNRVTEGGQDVTVNFTEEEKKERAALIARIAKSIDNFEHDEDGEEGRMNAGMFMNLIESYDDGEGRDLSDGYYFSEGSAFTKEFASVYPTLVARALALETGHYGTCEEGGIRFFFAATEPTASADTLTGNARYFTDFYSRVADASFEKTLALFLPDVTLSEVALSFDILSLPYNSEFVFR